MCDKSNVGDENQEDDSPKVFEWVSEHLEVLDMVENAQEQAVIPEDVVARIALLRIAELQKEYPNADFGELRSAAARKLFSRPPLPPSKSSPLPPLGDF
jgi:hypothetical protein